MLRRSFTYKSFVILPIWIFPRTYNDSRLMHVRQRIEIRCFPREIFNRNNKMYLKTESNQRYGDACARTYLLQAGLSVHGDIKML